MFECFIRTMFYRLSFHKKIELLLSFSTSSEFQLTLSKGVVFGNILIFYLFHVPLLCALPKYYSQFYYFSFFFICVKQITITRGNTLNSVNRGRAHYAKTHHGATFTSCFGGPTPDQAYRLLHRLGQRLLMTSEQVMRFHCGSN